MDASVSRRRVICGAAAALSSLAGCGDRPPRRTSRAVIVTNAAETEFTVTVRLYALPAGAVDATPTADGTPTAADVTATETGPDPPTDDLEEVLVQRETLSPEGSFGVSGEGLPAGALRVGVTTTDGQSNSYDWARVDERSTLDARIGENAVRFTELD
ncbi:hypothetical protein BRC84_05045 [Halobacteriales archaeon QS_1_68_44]|nr:MAG: hypothetical protein BRC84_05045 [Halobacteriales archaeon QS_1_68_44]